MKRLLFVLTLIVLFTACKEEVLYPNLSYTCECGSINWDGNSYDLTDSHYVATATDSTEQGLLFDAGKDYYITAKVELEDELEPHHFNMKISVPDLSLGVQTGAGGSSFYAFEEDIFNVEIEEVNFNSISVVDQYAVSAGSMTITSELASTLDDISFEFEVFLTVGGSAAGTPFVYTGSFSSEKQEL